jgi:predicted DNA binding protein
MAQTIRAEIEIGEPKTCPVARASEMTGSRIDDVTRSSVRGVDGAAVEEFTVRADSTPESDCERTERSPSAVEGDPIFDCESHTVYQFSRDTETACVCERVELFGRPVSDVRADDGSLFVTCYLSDSEQFSALVTDLRDQFGDVSVRELSRSGGETAADPRLVDCGRLTGRQREILEVAHEMGYFDYPKGANAGEVAASLDITRSTFSEHLAAAQQKVFDSLVDD